MNFENVLETFRERVKKIKLVIRWTSCIISQDWNIENQADIYFQTCQNDSGPTCQNKITLNVLHNRIAWNKTS